MNRRRRINELRRVVTAAAPWITAAYSPDAFQDAACYAVFVDCFNHVGAATRFEAADMRQERTDNPLVKQDGQNKNKADESEH